MSDSNAPGDKALPRVNGMSLLRTIRAPFALLVLSGIALLVPPQIADMLEALEDGTRAIGDTVRFHAALALLALCAWYWSRTLVAARFDVPDHRDQRMALGDVSTTVYDIVPRLMYVLAVLVGVGVIVRSGVWSSLLYVAAWALPLGVAVFRRTAMRPAHPTRVVLPILLVCAGLIVWPETRQRLLVLVVCICQLAVLTWLGERLVMRVMTPGAPRTEGPGMTHQAMQKTGNAADWFRSLPRRFALLITRAPWPNWISLMLVLASAETFIWGLVESFTRWGAGHVGLPAIMAELFPGPAAALVSLALIIAPLSVVTFLADGLDLSATIAGVRLFRRPPVISFLIIWATIAPTFFSLHTVRIVNPDEEGDGVRPVQRMGLEDIFKSWATVCAPVSQDADGRQVPVRPVIVAVSGGASRAAVWAERVLAEVESASGAGRPRIFAVSSVSGGSLGAAAYMAAMAALPEGKRCSDDAARARQMRLLADHALSEDAVGPLLAGALLVDIPRALATPVPQILRIVWHVQPRGGDRAEALEKGFEALWQKAGANEDAGKNGTPPLFGFDRPYLSLFYDVPPHADDAAAARTIRGVLKAGMPLWIANGTDLDTGSRIVTAPFDPNAQWPLLASADALSALGADVRISTAINNTARFPFLEPAGELLAYESKASLEKLPLDHRHPVRGTAREVIDGGYFDNEGLQTALDLRAWLMTEGSKALGGRVVEPIIVQATADGDPTPNEAILRCEPHNDDPSSLASTRLPFQVLAPVLGLTNVRSGHSAVLLRQARTAMCADATPPVYRCDRDTGLPVRCVTPDATRQHFFHFYLPGDGNESVPLNWVLSDKIARFIWRDAMCGAGNAQEAWILRNALGGAAVMDSAAGKADAACPGLPGTSAQRAPVTTKPSL